MRFSEMLAAPTGDGDLSAVVLPTAPSTSKIQISFSESGVASRSSVLQCTTSSSSPSAASLLHGGDFSKARGNEIRSDVCQQSLTTSATAERIPKALSRNLQRRDREQQAKDAVMAATASNRPRAGVSFSSSATAVCQEAIKEDFFRGGGGSSLSYFARKSLGESSAGSEYTPTSRAASMGQQAATAHVSPVGPVRKVDHGVKGGEEGVEDELRPGGSAKGNKRRRNQQKRIVCVPVAASGRPTTEGLPADLWAWRKYGQKPIKGSPYPRGYYRCSSSKGCSARKQVERSRTDPAMLIITYTAEHNHHWPSHRNALAGSARMSSLEHSSGPEEFDKASHDAIAGSEDQERSEEEQTEMSPPPRYTLRGELREKDEEDDYTTAAVAREMMVDRDGLAGRASIGMQDDVFGDLEELPDTHFLLGGGMIRPGGVIMEDRSDDDCGVDHVDPYNLFCWSSASGSSGTSYLEANAVG